MRLVLFRAIVFADLLLLSVTGCTPSAQVQKVDANIPVRSLASVGSTFFLWVHDAQGHLLTQETISPPVGENTTITLNNIPRNGYISFARRAQNRRSWPRQGDFDSLYILTFPVEATQENDPLPIIILSDSPHFETSWPDEDIIYIESTCPNGAEALATSASQYAIVHIPGSFSCANGATEGDVWLPRQYDGKHSVILWATDGSWRGYIQPLTYAEVWDANTGSQILLTENDFKQDVEIWRLEVVGAPENTSLSYIPAGIRKGAEVTGTFTYYYGPDCENTDSLCNEVYAAKVDDRLDGYVLAAQLSKTLLNGSSTTSAHWERNDNPAHLITWNYTTKFLPLFTSVQIQYAPFAVQVAGGPDENYQVLHFWRVKGENSPYKYLYWYIYDFSGSDRIRMPELPSTLSDFEPADNDEVAFTHFRRYDFDPIRPQDHRFNGNRVHTFSLIDRAMSSQQNHLMNFIWGAQTTLKIY